MSFVARVWVCSDMYEYCCLRGSVEIRVRVHNNIQSAIFVALDSWKSQPRVKGWAPKKGVRLALKNGKSTSEQLWEFLAFIEVLKASLFTSELD